MEELTLTLAPLEKLRRTDDVAKLDEEIVEYTEIVEETERDAFELEEIKGEIEAIGVTDTDRVSNDEIEGELELLAVDVDDELTELEELTLIDGVNKLEYDIVEDIKLVEETEALPLPDSVTRLERDVVEVTELVEETEYNAVELEETNAELEKEVHALSDGDDDELFDVIGVKVAD